MYYGFAQTLVIINNYQFECYFAIGDPGLYLNILLGNAFMKEYHAIIYLWDKKVHFGGWDFMVVPFAKVPCTSGQNSVIMHCASATSHDTVINF